MKWLAIALGGACGAMLRAAISQWLAPTPGQFPWATFVANVGGCFLMGVLYVLVVDKQWIAPSWRPFLLIGFLGALTTFSTFAMETLSLWQLQRFVVAGVYLLGSVSACLVAVSVGFFATERLIEWARS